MWGVPESLLRNNLLFPAPNRKTAGTPGDQTGPSITGHSSPLDPIRADSICQYGGDRTGPSITVHSSPLDPIRADSICQYGVRFDFMDVTGGGGVHPVPGWTHCSVRGRPPVRRLDRKPTDTRGHGTLSRLGAVLTKMTLPVTTVRILRGPPESPPESPHPPAGFAIQGCACGFVVYHGEWRSNFRNVDNLALTNLETSHFLFSMQVVQKSKHSWNTSFAVLSVE